MSGKVPLQYKYKLSSWTHQALGVQEARKHVKHCGWTLWVMDQFLSIMECFFHFCEDLFCIRAVLQQGYGLPTMITLQLMLSRHLSGKLRSSAAWRTTVGDVPPAATAKLSLNIFEFPGNVAFVTLSVKKVFLSQVKTKDKRLNNDYFATFRYWERVFHQTWQCMQRQTSIFRF